ncbi:hypothetical protein DTO282F9_9243 [Paecilomyces variotii]|nr:hypothetical protein DTO282F9_9243 [Paecilomyces variotii]
MHLSRLATAPGEKPPGAGWRIAMSPRAGIDPLQTTEVTKRVVRGLAGRGASAVKGEAPGGPAADRAGFCPRAWPYAGGHVAVVFTPGMTAVPLKVLPGGSRCGEAGTVT